MYKKDIVSRIISKKLCLSRKVQEQYTHPDISAIPDGFKYSKPILIPSKTILDHFYSILFTDKYDFIICNSIPIKPEVLRQINKIKDKILFFSDQHCDSTADMGLESVLEQHRRLHPSFIFDILDIDTLFKYASASKDTYDTIFSVNDKEIIQCIIKGIHMSEYIQQKALFGKHLECKYSSNENSHKKLQASLLECQISNECTKPFFEDYLENADFIIEMER
jgi:hypothetical protein